MPKAVRLIILALPIFALVALQPEAGEARNLFDILFGRKQVEPPPPPAPKKRVIKKKPKVATQPKSNPKAADAKRVLVLGDFVGSAVVDGLNQIYANNTDVVITSATNGSSGLVRTDFYNWQTSLAKIVAKEKPDIVIVSLGANDNQIMKIGEASYRLDQKEWNDNYRQRVASFATALKDTGKPWIWMGQPSFKDEDLSRTMVGLNSIFKQASETAGGRFVDVWDGFVDDQGNFALSGYDVNGQTARLRANDGVNFTTAGKRKLAFYLEKPLEAVFNLQGTESPETIAADPNGPVISMLPRDVDRVEPISFYDMARQNNGLLGDLKDPANPETVETWTPKNREHAGRADNFSAVQ